MTIQHKELSEGKWQTMSFLEQMGNIGSEVSRCIKWKNKNDKKNSAFAFERALELLDMTIQDPKNIKRLRELTRVRETFIDYIEYGNQYHATDLQWEKYFLAFGYAARNIRTA